MIQYYKILFCASVLMLYTYSVPAQEFKKGINNSGRRTTGTASMAKLNINNISTYVYNDGTTDVSPSGEAGFVYPKGSGKKLFYESGLLIGGYTDNGCSVSGSAYRSALKPGRILPDGTAESPDLPHVRTYRVRSDYKNYTDTESMNLLFASEIADEGKTAQEIFAQYELDRQQWPAQYGAPYIDKDGNGLYNPAIDVPGVSEEPCQTIWYVANDLDPAAVYNLYSGKPMKIEMQATVFAFKGDKPFDNTVFRKYKIINRNNVKIDTMYTCMFSDPDLGNFYDDLLGCDSTLNLAFVYNNNISDNIYGFTPPSTGYILLQGPTIPGSITDSALYSGRWKKGYKNLGMTAFYYYIMSSDDEPWSPDYYLNQWKYIMKGRRYRGGSPYIDPTTKKVTKFPMSGDPVIGNGWLDNAVNDKRMGNIAGPFTMNPGDTQEVLFAQVAAGGTTGIGRLPAVFLLKFYAKLLMAVTGNIKVPLSLPVPVVKVSEYDNSVILSWTDSVSYHAAESFNKYGFKFEGYNVYQLPKADSKITDGVRIATFDLINGINAIAIPVIDETTGIISNRTVAYGTDSGIIRYCKIMENKLTGVPLYSGSKYYFAVTAYAYNPDSKVISGFIESPNRVLTIIPQSVKPGERFSVSAGDTLTVEHAAGLSEGSILVQVVDPKQGDGKEYKVNFPDENHYNILNGDRVITANKPVAGIAADNPIISGAQVHVKKPFGLGLKECQVLSGSNPWSETGLNLWFVVGWHNNLWHGGLQLGYDWWYNGSWGLNIYGSSLSSYGQFHDVIIKFSSTVNGSFNASDANASMGYRYMRGANSTPANSAFAPFIKNKLNYGFQEFGLSGGPNIPIAVFDQVTGKRLDVGLIENNIANGTVDGIYYPPLSAAMGGPSVNVREAFFIFNTEYQTTARPEFSQLNRELLYNTTYGPLPIMYWINAPRVKEFSSADEILIKSYKVFSTEDRYTFTIPTPVTNIESAKEDVNRINVFPNPYYGLPSEAMSRAEGRVTFTHLPAHAVIKIFNVSGQLVKAFYKSDNSQFQVWDLKTDANRDVASGIYIAHIELPDLGEVKTLKIAVFMGQQYRVRY